MLDKVALFIIFMLIIMVAAAIVFIGSIPGKIARKRNHPWPDAVNTASWIGLATGVFWPIALIWAFLPVPVKSASAEPSGSGGDRGSNEEVDDLRKRVADLEAALQTMKSAAGESAS